MMIAIVWAPNLYRIDTSVAPVEGLIKTQKSAKFLQVVINGILQRDKDLVLASSSNNNSSPSTMPSSTSENDLLKAFLGHRRSQSVGSLHENAPNNTNNNNTNNNNTNKNRPQSPPPVRPAVPKPELKPRPFLSVNMPATRVDEEGKEEEDDDWDNSAFSV